jgi:acetyl esterase/lipase
MRFTTLCLFLLCLCCVSIAQPCDGSRYYQQVFTTVKTTSGITYGSNVQPTIGNPTATATLKLDLYEPQGDTQAKRPLVILAFGGAFVTGFRTSPDLVDLATRYAKLGYVVASIDYRLTQSLITQQSAQAFYLALFKAVHDMKASIRFFYKDAASVNLYRIDTQKIIVGGVSAGGITAASVAYINSLSDVPSVIQSDLAALGGLEGLSGNAGYSSRIYGAISLSGALADTSVIDAGEVPLVALHGSTDGIVPPVSGNPNFGGISTPITLYGGIGLHQQALRVGVQSSLYVWAGAGHTPFILAGNAPAYLDTTYTFTRDWLYYQICGTQAPTAVKPSDNRRFNVYPNPATSTITIESTKDDNSSFSLYNTSGQFVQTIRASNSGNSNINLTHLPRGLYYLRSTSSNPSEAIKLILE